MAPHCQQDIIEGVWDRPYDIKTAVYPAVSVMSPFNVSPVAIPFFLRGKHVTTAPVHDSVRWMSFILSFNYIQYLSMWFVFTDYKVLFYILLGVCQFFHKVLAHCRTYWRHLWRPEPGMHVSTYVRLWVAICRGGLQDSGRSKEVEYTAIIKQHGFCHTRRCFYIF